VLAHQNGRKIFMGRNSIWL